MKILYGVQGTGNGHIARARIMARALAERDDIDIDFVFSGREPDSYFDMQCFGDYSTYKGLTFHTYRGQVDELRTLAQAKPKTLFRDIRQLDVSQYDVLLNDFEPVTAWAARFNKLPSISVSHQAAFNYPVPKAGARLSDKVIMRLFAPTDIQLGVHWFHFNQPILPPFVADKPIDMPTNDHVLVYLPFESIDDIHTLLDPLSDEKFTCYHPKAPLDTEHTPSHIEWKRPSKEGFRHALQHCSGVIANGGFELSSEALQLGKKLLIKPLIGQFEQLSNVRTLERLNLCHPLFRLDTDIVEEWLTLPPGEPITYPDDPHPMLDWLLKRQWNDTQSITDYLWQQVHFPDKLRERLMTLAF
jgi:uncharacterized protein (TIGR00661 family)